MPTKSCDNCAEYGKHNECIKGDKCSNWVKDLAIRLREFE